MAFKLNFPNDLATPLFRVVVAWRLVGLGVGDTGGVASFPAC